ncbi:glycerol-3-phosphate dehydrogenase/oxidase [Arsenicibacter rosenii]|uniref:Glycerol-3-phosphate dehydrogenase n=1 Tax=Arsenicibacter rosenii TaxID=1750698 RepID=A0A1S2VH69_9BACT|nr:glycerol-3-phosphate dehydrogenase/oxidase [Arsenicibacter rosenii]OIN57228.1 glycerol-3-phosphate dehydrogenase [Arsenicibacter rosenii]
MNRVKHLNRLRSESFDICIIGAGATGAGCALDAASRGLKTALIDQGDFCSVTSGTSTKLVHGGVRYLEQAFKKLDPKQLSLVRKALHERMTLLKIAPHLAHPLALLTPCKSWFDGMYYSVGLKLYDLLAGNRQLKPSQWLSKKEALAHFPAFNPDKLHSAVLYYDGQFDDTRLNLALVQTAAQKGAAVANYLKAVHFRKNETGKLTAIEVEDTLTGETFTIRATVFVNATGTLADQMRQDASPGKSQRMRASKGSHVVMPMAAVGKAQAALLVPSTSDGRVLFAIPWRGHYLIGTTDTEAHPNDVPHLVPEEAAYLTEHVNQYLANPLSTSQITGGFAGLRPLLQPDHDNAATESRSVVRDHEVEVDQTSGLVSIMGGKWTTYRLMAEETIDRCCQLSGHTVKSNTETLAVAGGDGFTGSFQSEFRKAFSHLPADTVEHLLFTYGTNAAKIAGLAREQASYGQLLVEGHPFIRAEVIYALTEEMAQTMDDVLMRRIRLGLVDWEAALAASRPTGEIMGHFLNWSAEQTQQAVQAFTQTIQLLAGQAGVWLRTKEKA